MNGKILMRIVLLAVFAIGCAAPTPAPHAPAPQGARPPSPSDQCFGNSSQPHAVVLPEVPIETHAFEGTVARIDVRVAGQLDESIVRGLISSKPGEPLDRVRVASDLRRIHGLGNFEDVMVEAEKAGSGWALIYTVRERPVLGAVVFRGADPELEPGIIDAAGQHHGDLYVPSAVRGSARSVREHLIEKGYARASVSTFERRTSDRTVDLCFQVNAGPLVRVEAVHFDGASRSNDELVGAMRGAGVDTNLPGGRLDEKTLDTQLLYVSAFYYDNGMLQVRLGEPEMRYSTDGARVVIRVPVEEGPVFHIGEITFAGTLAANATKYRALLGVSKGQVFNRTALMNGMNQLNSVLESEGSTPAAPPETNLDPDRRTVDLTFSPASP